MLPPQAPYGSWRFPITGADAGFAWQSDLPGSGPHAFFPVVPDSEPVDEYAATRIERVDGPHGAPTRALYQEVTRDAKFRPHARVRNQFPLHRPGHRGTVAYWIKLQRNLPRVMPPHERSWRYLMELRGTRRRGSDFRIAVGIGRHGTRPFRWRIVGARLVPRYHVNWASTRSRPRVPIGKWFRLKVSWLIDRSDGRFRVSVNGKRIADHEGRTRRNRPVDSIQIFKVYTSANSLVHGRAFQWIDDVELRRWKPKG